jgi:(1->4)-alpha-D-glucan 1-alpha-D-glucosylmutase
MKPKQPLATYRLQFSAKFQFRDAIGILDYLRELGVSHVYASPVFSSRTGSGHGYDVTDPTKIDPDLGGEEGFAELQAAIAERGMGLLLDIVPNHMAASSENRWWMDVLEYGPDSSYASYFDINWRAPSPFLENRLLLPFLAKPFGEVLDQGELQIRYDEGRFFLVYQTQTFPIAPETYADILRFRNRQLNEAVEPESPAEQEWLGIVAAGELIAADRNLSAQAASERRTRFEQLRDRLKQLVGSSAEIANFLQRTLAALNGSPDDKQTFDALERILGAQHYRLAFWQTASDSINYRRFFSITDLVGVRVEDPAVFDSTHEAIIRAALRPDVTGLRIDHIDGLRDPRGYLTRLRERLTASSVNESNEGVDQAPPYIVVEKILGRRENLPDDWPVEGTTGYNYLNFANRLMIDSGKAPAMINFYTRWTGVQPDFEELLYQEKKLVMRTLLGVEMRALGRELTELASNDRYARELRAGELTEALVETTACLPIYRTYVQSLEESESTQAVLESAIRKARERRQALPAECFDFLGDVLLLKAAPHVRPDQRENRFTFVSRWQQFTGSIMAKGFEDTALYVYFPLAALNEVGGHPIEFQDSVSEFHDYIRKRQEKWPYSMNATTTHDTKRSEDARARLAVLSEIPLEWEAALGEWSRMNEPYVMQLDGAAAPDRNEQFLFYQTLIATWPIGEAGWQSLLPRVQDYMIKAIREAKVHTRWSAPNEPHEKALAEFISGVLDRESNRVFLAHFTDFQKRTACYGMLNGLSQTVLKIACPGVPDIYQGADLWDFRLVDPDNRGPIDFSRQIAMLSELQRGHGETEKDRANDLLASWCDARVKLHVLSRALRARRDNSALFLDGSYIPLEVTGEHHERVMAFARSYESEWALAIVPRCLAGLNAPILGAERSAFWNSTSVTLPSETPRKWINVLDSKDAPCFQLGDGRISLAEAFKGFPVALLLPVAR